MKIQYNILYLFVGLFLTGPFSGDLIAQSKPDPYRIYGIVADSVTRKAVSFSTLSLITAQSTSAGATASKADGSFSLEVSIPGKYRLNIIATGYHNKTVLVELEDSARTRITLDTVFMIAKTNRLKEVIISAARSAIRQEADRIIYDLQADPESKSSNVLMMMRKVPFISTDANDNLLLKGSSSFKVLINGKPSAIADNNLKAVLQSMPASTIQSIEIITNPPAKYDAEGLAGIINIITNKKVDSGYKGTLNVNESFPVGGLGAGGSFSLRQGKLGINSYAGISASYLPQTEFRNDRSTFGSNETSLVQSGLNRSKSKTGYFGAELSYEIDSLNLLTGQFSMNGNRADGQSKRTSQLTGSAGSLQRYNLRSSGLDRGTGIDASLNYQLGFKSHKNRLLTFSYRYLDSRNEQLNNIDIVNAINFSTPDYRQNNNTTTSEETFQVDYVHPVKKLIIEVGIKGILRHSTSDYQYLLYSLLSGQYQVDPGSSDQFSYNQNVFSAYNSYRYHVKSWSFSGGVRAEQTNIGANFFSTATRINHNVFNIIPSVSLNKEFSDRSSISFGFNQRIKRPNIRRLNPFVDRSNPDFVFSGNPDLRPVLNNNLQLSYSRSKKLSVLVALSYSFIKNIDLRTSTFDTTKNVTHVTYQNTGKADYLGLDFNISYPLTSAWNLSINGTVGHFALSGLVGGSLIQNNLATDNISVATSYRFNKGWRVNGSLTTISRSPADLQATVNGLLRYSLSCNKEIIKNKLSLAALVNNPFTKYRNNITETNGKDFIQSNMSRDYFQSFSFSLNYNFGKLKRDIQKNKRGINNDDGSR
jgi:ferric enterobactin receptor